MLATSRKTSLISKLWRPSRLPWSTNSKVWTSWVKTTPAPVAEVSGSKPRSCLRMEIKPRLSPVDLDVLHFTSFHSQTFCYWNQQLLFSRHVRQLELVCDESALPILSSWTLHPVITWCSLRAQRSAATDGSSSFCPLNMPSAAKLLPLRVSDQRAADCCFLLFQKHAMISQNKLL